jgi:peptidoglycan/LPS O-acetylase OafA/YrhL
MQPTTRQAYLDWLRILAILGVLFFHSAMPYVSEEWWHIKNQETSNLLMEFNFWLSRFRMPLLFFVSGAVTYVMLQKRTASQFIGLRFRRLFIPLVFGMLLLVPIQVYMQRVNEGFKGNFWQFYPSVFTTGVYPKGNLSWHHLWFIAYLLTYDIVFAPLFKWCTVNKDKWAFITSLAKGKRIYFLMLPSVIVLTTLNFRFPETNDLIHDWCRFFYWLLFLLVGFTCLNFPSLIQSLERNRRISLTFAVLTFFTINYLRWNKLEPDNFFTDYQSHWQTYLYISLYALTAWLWVFSAIGYGKRYLDKKLPVLTYLNRAVYPFYILHQTVIVVLVYYVVKTSDTILMKYLFTVTATFLITMAIYHLFIRPYAIMRFLFGAKKEEEKVKKEKEIKSPEPVILIPQPA